MPSSHKESANGKLKGVIVQFGGQTPLKLAQALDAHDVPILGTSPDAIDLAEDRDRFKVLVDKLKLRQPKNGIAYSIEQALLASEEIGFPIVVRPSYVLGGRAMAIIPDQATLKDYFDTTLAAFVPRISTASRATGARRSTPCWPRRAAAGFLRSRCHRSRRGRHLRRQGCLHRRRDGAYRGGGRPFGRQRLLASAPLALRRKPCAELERQTAEIARALNVVGLMNVQYAIKGKDVSTCWRSIRAPAAPCPSSPRSSAIRWPRSPRGSWPARSLRAST